MMAFHHCHPSKPEGTLRLGHHGGHHKVSFNGGEPTGNWFQSYCPQDHAGELPTGIDRMKPILPITFHCNGDGSKEETALYGVVSGTTDVYRAIGQSFKDCMSRIYCDKELAILSHWHIVLVSSAV